MTTSQVGITRTRYNIYTCNTFQLLVLDSDNSELLRSCGTVLPLKVTSRGSRITVRFHTDFSVVRRGFRATWAEVTGGGATEVSCGGHTAASCSECGPWYWCNGDCAWSDGQCRDTVTVSS